MYKRQAHGGDRVEEGVAGRVRGLSGVAERRGQRGEEDERRQVEVAGEFVQVQDGVGLGPQDPLDPLGRQRAEHAVVQHAGGVDDRGERVLGGYRADQGGQRLPVGDVTGGHGDARP